MGTIFITCHELLKGNNLWDSLWGLVGFTLCPDINLFPISQRSFQAYTWGKLPHVTQPHNHLLNCCPITSLKPPPRKQFFPPYVSSLLGNVWQSNYEETRQLCAPQGTTNSRSFFRTFCSHHHHTGYCCTWLDPFHSFLFSGQQSTDPFHVWHDPEICFWNPLHMYKPRGKEEIVINGSMTFFGFVFI